jgi:hypothetical protein
VSSNHNTQGAHRSQTQTLRRLPDSQVIGQLDPHIYLPTQVEALLLTIMQSFQIVLLQKPQDLWLGQCVSLDIAQFHHIWL